MTTRSEPDHLWWIMRNDWEVLNYPVKGYRVLSETELSKAEAINRVGLTGSSLYIQPVGDAVCGSVDGIYPGAGYGLDGGV